MYNLRTLMLGRLTVYNKYKRQQSHEELRSNGKSEAPVSHIGQPLLVRAHDVPECDWRNRDGCSPVSFRSFLIGCLLPMPLQVIGPNRLGGTGKGAIDRLRCL